MFSRSCPAETPRVESRSNQLLLLLVAFGSRRGAAESCDEDNNRQVLRLYRWRNVVLILSVLVLSVQACFGASSRALK